MAGADRGARIIYDGPDALLIDSTLIRAVLDDPEAKVPAVCGGQAVLTLGSGSVVAVKARHLTVSEGVTGIMQGAITISRVLEELSLPASLADTEQFPMHFVAGDARLSSLKRIDIRRELDGPVEEKLRLISYNTGRHQRIIDLRAISDASMSAVSAFAGQFARPAHIDRAMGVLFVNENKTATLFDDRPCYDMERGTEKTSEYAVIKAMIKAGRTGYRHRASECWSDQVIRANRNSQMPGLCSVATVPMRPGRRSKEGPYHTVVTVRRHLLFSPALLPVRLHGVRYYIYSRQHQVADDNNHYQREDVCVFDDEGLVTNRALSEAVYAKARLLMVL